MIISSKPISKRGKEEPTTTPPRKPTNTRSASPVKQQVKRNNKTAAVTIAKKGPAQKNSNSNSNSNPNPNPNPKKDEDKDKTIKELAVEYLSYEREEERSGRCVILFNHYKKDFECYNGVVKFEDVDEIYAFSFVYKGKYRRDLILVGERVVGNNLIINKDLYAPPQDESKITPVKYAKRDEEGMYWINMRPEAIYKIQIEEDAEAGIGAEGLRIKAGPYKAGAYKASESCRDGSKAGNKAVNDITKELLKMDVKDLHGEEARKLREARDIEDVLFS